MLHNSHLTILNLSSKPILDWMQEGLQRKVALDPAFSEQSCYHNHHSNTFDNQRKRRTLLEVSQVTEGP